MNSFGDSLLLQGDLAMEGFSTEEIDEFITTLDPNVEYEWPSFSEAPIQEWASMLANDEMDVVYEEPAEAIISQDPDHPMAASGHEPTQLVTGDFSNDLSPKQGQPRRRIKASEWEQKRELIAVLYIDQEKTLAETRQTLLEEHGFFASEKAYKDKLKEWKMSKNLKSRQVKFMLKIARKRKAEEGKETIFAYNGRDIPGGKLQRYNATLSVDSIITSVPSLVTYHTPRISALAQTLVNSGESPILTGAANDRRAKPLTVDSDIFAELEANTDQSSKEYQRLLSFEQWKLVCSLQSIQCEHNKFHTASDSGNACIERYLDGISATFDKFEERLVAYKVSDEYMARVEQIISITQLALLLDNLQSAISWKQYYIFSLPIMLWKAKCFLALKQYSECERTVGKLLDECTTIEEAAGARCKLLWPAMQLLAKANLAQGNLYSLNSLLQSTISDMKQWDETESETLWLLKMLLTCRTLQLQMASRRSRKSFEASLHSAARTLKYHLEQSGLKRPKYRREEEEARFMLISIYTGLFRHRKFHKCDCYLDLLKAVEAIPWMATPSIKRRTANSLLHSYLYLDLREEAENLRLKWLDIAELGVRDPFLSGVSSNITDHVGTWLKTTWPYIQCPQVQESFGVVGDIYMRRYDFKTLRRQHLNSECSQV
ncbi:hypothetical protein MMC27_000153 [Xylographa pallens]|nr:hypothetical protein [Xylographa pallens]